MAKIMDFKIIDNSKKVLEACDDAIEKILEQWGIEVEKNAKLELNRSPKRIDTGLLHNSITHAVSGMPPAIEEYRGDNKSKYGTKEEIPSGSYSGTAPSDDKNNKAVYVGTNVEYAPYVHEGTRRGKKGMKPNRFLKNGVEKSKDKLKDMAKQILEQTNL